MVLIHFNWTCELGSMVVCIGYSVSGKSSINLSCPFDFHWWIRKSATYMHVITETLLRKFINYDTPYNTTYSKYHAGRLPLSPFSLARIVCISPHVILSSRSADNDQMQSTITRQRRADLNDLSTFHLPSTTFEAVGFWKKKKESISSKSRCLQNAPYCSRLLILPIPFPASQVVNDWPACPVVAGSLACLGSTDLVLPGSRCERRPNLSQRDYLRKRKYLRSSKPGRHD